MPTLLGHLSPAFFMRIEFVDEAWAVAGSAGPGSLLVEADEPLSRPVMERARMVRLMKTAAALLEAAPTAPVRRMAENLVEQLNEIMPELKEVSAWHSVGQRRSLDEYGRIMTQAFSASALAPRVHRAG